MSQIRLPNGDFAESLVLIDALTGLPSDIGGGGSATTTTQTYYKVISAFAGASVNDVLLNVRIIDNANGSIATSIWSNITTGQPIALIPASTDISQLSDQALTDSQLEVRLREIGTVGSDGAIFNPSGCQQTIAYDADGNVSYIDATTATGKVYRQAFTWANGQLTAVSNWVKQ